MPELPEVETVKRGLNQQIQKFSKIHSLRFLSPAIRNDLPFTKAPQASGQRILKISRRAKYLLFELDDLLLLSHLGMTGSWRFENFCQLSDLDESPKLRDHDHIEICLEDGRVLVYRDPRRFGQFEILQKQGGLARRFKNLGPEPLDEGEFTGDYLFNETRKRKAPIKSLIMDQQIVVGVGNIYASEALFLAGINPNTAGDKLTLKAAKNLVYSIREVLGDAIEFGGSTISDFRQAGGSEGYFQNIHLVYNEAGYPCAECDSTISSRVIAGRSTYWCPKCQTL